MFRDKMVIGAQTHNRSYIKIFCTISLLLKEVLANQASFPPCDSEIIDTLLKTYVMKSDLLL